MGEGWWKGEVEPTCHIIAENKTTNYYPSSVLSLFSQNSFYFQAGLERTYWQIGGRGGPEGLRGCRTVGPSAGVERGGGKD